jgi:7,8-dihydro-6-hydroxymethylpterin-pyrophosphokinase
MSTRVFVGVGSSIDPAVHVPRALGSLDRGVGLLGLSTFYRTPAIGRPKDPPFVNGVVEVRAVLAPAPLKALTRELRRTFAPGR